MENRNETFLAVASLPAGATRESVLERLEALDSATEDEGIRAVETMFSVESGRAFTVVEADTEERVRRVHERAGLTLSEVLRTERVFTEFLHEPRRMR